jgi:ribonuclease HI
MGKAKFYVVWKGRAPGIYQNWSDYQQQINGFKGAAFKAFKTRQLAEQAFKDDGAKFIGVDFHETELSEEQLLLIGKPIEDSIAVDGAWDTSTGKIEFRGVYVNTGEEVFHRGPYDDGTNNIAEFLAIVLGLAHCKQNKLTMPIYSDSRNAIGWIRDKEARTNLEFSEKNTALFDMLEKAIKWLTENEYSNKVLKWETRAWGENPADFGRK